MALFFLTYAVSVFQIHLDTEQPYYLLLGLGIPIIAGILAGFLSASLLGEKEIFIGIVYVFL